MFRIFAFLFLLATAIPIAQAYEHNYVRPGETVWTTGGSEGVVQAIFPDGRVSVRIGYNNYTMSRDQLATRGCYRNLCSNQQVVTTGGSQGEINGIFQSGMYSVKIGYNNYMLAYDQLASTSPYPPPPPDHPPYYPPGLRVGEVVWTTGGSEGQVIALFPNGDASVKIGYTNYRMGRSTLAVRGCVRRLCSGDNVITTGGSRGTVNGVFVDNRLSVRIGYSNYVFNYSQLAKTRD